MSFFFFFPSRWNWYIPVQYSKVLLEYRVPLLKSLQVSLDSLSMLVLVIFHGSNEGKPSAPVTLSVSPSPASLVSVSLSYLPSPGLDIVCLFKWGTHHAHTWVAYQWLYGLRVTFFTCFWFFGVKLMFGCQPGERNKNIAYIIGVW